MFNALMFMLFLGLTPTFSWDLIESKIEIDFPNTPTVTIEDLNNMMLKNSKKTLIIDVRSKSEYDVSHIKGALHFEDPQIIDVYLNKYTKEHGKPDNIILYCSVGYRSAKAAQALIMLGHNKVYNLKGSIFAWGNKGFDVYRSSKDHEIPTDKIHPYDQSWGLLLDENLRSYTPSQSKPMDH